MSRTARMLYALALGIIAATAAIGWRAYDRIPARIPTHYGLDGPDAWADKGFWSVFGLLVGMAIFVGLLALLGVILGRTALPAEEGETTQSTAARSAIARRIGTEGLARVAVILVTLICGMNLFTWFRSDVTPPRWAFTLVTVAVLVGVFGSLLWTYRRSAPEVAALSDDPEGHWKGGIFYVNREDPRAVLPKRFGYGWTFNFGARLVQLITAAVLLGLIAALAISLT